MHAHTAKNTQIGERRETQRTIKDIQKYTRSASLRRSSTLWGRYCSSVGTTRVHMAAGRGGDGRHRHVETPLYTAPAAPLYTTLCDETSERIDGTHDKHLLPKGGVNDREVAPGGTQRSRTTNTHAQPQRRGEFCPRKQSNNRLGFQQQVDMRLATLLGR